MKLHLVAIRQGHLLESCVSWVAHRALSDGSLAISRQTCRRAAGPTQGDRYRRLHTCPPVMSRLTGLVFTSLFSRSISSHDDVMGSTAS